MATARWQGFFKDAGIPGGPAGDYAIIFSDNRMRMDMLNELNKEILADLGIKVMGDVIAILRHSKKVYAEISRSAAEEFDVNNTKSRDEKGRNQIHSDTKTKPQTDLIVPPERKRDPGVKEPPKLARERRENRPEGTSPAAGSKAKKPLKSLSSRFGEYSATPTKKWKEGKDEVITISVPVGETTKHRKVPTKEKPPAPKDIDAIVAQKKSVFDRLGSASTDPKTADEPHSSSDSPVKEGKIGNVFTRLGEISTPVNPAIEQDSSKFSTNISSKYSTNISSRFSSLSKTTTSTPSEPVLTVTVGRRDPARVGQARNNSTLRPVKHVKPLPRKPLAMDIESGVRVKPLKGEVDLGSKLKSVNRPESRLISKSVFDRLGK